MAPRKKKKAAKGRKPARKTKAKKLKKAKKVSRKAKKPAKKKAAKKSKAKKSKAAKAKSLGKVVHYYDRIGVAVLKVTSPISVGDMIRIKRGIHEVVQRVTSMQIEHMPVVKATKGMDIGLKVDLPVEKGALVMPM